MGTLAEQLKRIVGPPGRRRALVAVVVALVAGITLVAGGTSLAADESASLARQQGGRTIAADDGAYKAEVSFGEAAGLPEGVTLEIVTLDEDSDEYAAAREAVTEAEHAADESFDEQTLGMAALDIALRDAKGREVEPKGAVSVRLEMRDLPDEVAGQDIDVRHITAEDGVAEFVQQDVSTTDGTATAEFSVEGFSVFTITWTRDTSSAQRVGAVRLHTVDESGTEITDTASYTTAELSRISGESGILDIAAWVGSKAAPEGYTYKEARLHSASGTVITGLKVAASESASGDTYTLQYTSGTTVGSSSTWVDLRADVSDLPVNNADVYLVFAAGSATAARPVRIHFMTLTGSAITDEAGTAIVKAIDAAEHTSEYDMAQFAADNAPAGYAFDTTLMNTNTTERCQMILETSGGTQSLGSIRGTYYRYLRYQSGQVQMARGDRRWTSVSSTGADVYATFKAIDKTATFTVHYVDESRNPLDGQSDETFTLPLADGSTTKELSSGSLVRSIDDKYFVGSYLGVADSSLTQNTGYVTTDYQNVTRVRIGDDGGRYFLLRVAEGSMELDMTRSNRWAYTTAEGRTFTLRRVVTGSGDTQSVRYSLVDDQIGTTAFDLSLQSASGTEEVYTGSASSEDKSTVYTVTATTQTSGSATSTTYTLDVSEWVKSDLTDIYQVYADVTSDVITDPKIEIKNDLVYSGHLVVQMESALQTALAGDGVSEVAYTWYKSVNNASFEEVARQESGYTWNVARDSSQRTWLDLAADGGALSADRQSVRYYCILTYRVGDSRYSATSNTLSMINYDELMNGGFETPTMTSNQVSNSWYYSRGVWRTTGLGTGSATNRDIEIVNDQWSWAKGAYSWNTNQTFAAEEGHQFAELNCEAAGALYQDVVTLPYENLNYWLSHRARGRYATSAREYDTMYLVIMPTKLAMTSGANGGELKEQGELESYISSHGGFANNLATSEEAVVTYRDEDSGVLIERISSSDQAWHSVNTANGYTAAAGLTRFFFVAGPTASGSSTVGNFLDGVGFSQDLPDPGDDEFQLVVTKTFSNLSIADISRMAQGVDESPFTLTVRAYDTQATAEGRPAVSDVAADGSNGDLTLDHARLAFTVSGDGQVTPVATGADGRDLFGSGNGSNGTVVINDEAGTVTMTWTLLDNSVSGTRYYTVDESDEDLAGYSNTATQAGSVTHGSSTTAIGSERHVAQVSGGDVVRMDFTNNYNRNNQIRVQKVFSGITPTTVAELAGLPYTVTLTNKSQENAELHLVYDEQKPYSDSTLPKGVQDVELAFSQGSGGVSILTWTITGWDAGNYVVQESNYHPQGEASRYNTLAGITINGQIVSDGAAGAQVSVAKEVTIGGTSADVPTVMASNSSTGSAAGTVTLADQETDLLVVQYKNGDTTGYLVWTPQAVGVNVRQAILNHIRLVFGDEGASLEHVTFYSSENPGVMLVNDASVTYDPTTRQVTFSSSVNTLWQSYYSTPYTLERTVTEDGRSTTEIVANDEPEIRIRNNYNPIVKIQKIEQGHNDRLLGGASFEIYRYKDGGTAGEREYYLSSSTVSKAQFGEVTGESPAKTFTTSSEEDATLGTVNVGVLPAGTYYLEEVEAPRGYNGVSDIGFYVSSAGVVTLVGEGGASANRTEYAEVTLTDPYYTITVSDELGALLPDAGGLGGITVSAAYLAALVVVTLASGAFVVLRRRGGGRAGM